MEVFSIFRRRVPKLRCRRCAWCETSWRDSRFRFGRRVVFHVAFFWVISCHIMVQPLGIAQSVAMFCWWFGTFWLFVSVGNVIIPTDELIFFRGVQTTNQLEFVEGHWSFLFIVGCASVEIRGNRVESINLTHISFHTIKWDIQYIYITVFLTHLLSGMHPQVVQIGDTPTLQCLETVFFCYPFSEQSHGIGSISFRKSEVECPKIMVFPMEHRFSLWIPHLCLLKVRHRC